MCLYMYQVGNPRCPQKWAKFWCFYGVSECRLPGRESSYAICSIIQGVTSTYKPVVGFSSFDGRHRSGQVAGLRCRSQISPGFHKTEDQELFPNIDLYRP